MGQLHPMVCQKNDGPGIQVWIFIRQTLPRAEKFEVGIWRESLNFREEKRPYPVGFVDDGGLMCLFVEQIQFKST